MTLIMSYEGFFYLKPKIYKITELIEFSILRKLYIGPGMVLGYLIFRFKSFDGFMLLSVHPSPKIEIKKDLYQRIGLVDGH